MNRLSFLQRTAAAIVAGPSALKALWVEAQRPVKLNYAPAPTGAYVHVNVTCTKHQCKVEWKVRGSADMVIHHYGFNYRTTHGNLNEFGVAYLTRGEEDYHGEVIAQHGGETAVQSFTVPALA